MSALSKNERQEMSLLLPWYANGTLDGEDSRKVEAALAQDDELAREFDLVLQDQAAVVDLLSEEEVPVSMPERFRAALHGEQTKPDPGAELQEIGESVLDRLVAFLFPTRPRAYAFVAAMVVLLVPAVAILSFQAGSRQDTQYQTATGAEQSAGETARLLVKFNPDVTWADIDAFLRANRGQVVKGPTADGLYELAFQSIEGLTEKAGVAPGIFEFVLPVN